MRQLSSNDLKGKDVNSSDFNKEQNNIVCSKETLYNLLIIYTIFIKGRGSK